MTVPQTFLPKKGNYRDLACYKKAVVIYDLTFFFTSKYLSGHKDRTVDQMVQAARSGKQNIVEGCAAAATSRETELKLLNVARASMHELLADYEDFLRVRGFEKWPLDDERTRKTQAYCNAHEASADFLEQAQSRTPQTTANIIITLIHQYDVLIRRYIEYLEKSFVEEGGIRERMTAARLGHRNAQKEEITQLKAENTSLKQRLAWLEETIRKAGLMGLMGGMSLIRLIGHMGHIGLIGHIGLMGLIGHIGLMGHIGSIGLIALMGLSSCSQGEEAEVPVPGQEGVEAITFSGMHSDAEEVQAVRSRATSLHDHATNSFRVYAYKNDGYDAGTYTSTQQVMDAYRVDWQTARTTTNSDNWEYVDQANGQYIKYWDWSASAYRFFAYAPADATGITTDITSHTVGTRSIHDNVRFSFDASADAPDALPYVSHLWFSTGNATLYPTRLFGRTVKMEFVKPLARVRFIFVYPEGDAIYDHSKLSEISFAPVEPTDVIALNGTLHIDYPLTGTATAETWTTTPAATGNLAALTEDWQEGVDEKWYDVLPNTSQGPFQLSVKVFNSTRTAAVPAQLMTWQAGFEYTYVFKITEDDVYLQVVQTAVRNWTTVVTDPHELYNW